jgi:hypothetical protein
MPPQLGQALPGNVCTHSAHQVHSNEQMNASSPDAKRSRSQHSQFGRISNITVRLSFGLALGRYE